MGSPPGAESLDKHRHRRLNRMFPNEVATDGSVGRATTHRGFPSM